MLATLPLFNDVNYTLTTNLSGTTVLLRFWYNGRASSYYVDASLPDGTTLFTSKKIEPNSLLMFPIEVVQHGFFATFWLLPNVRGVSQDMLFWADNYTLVVESYEMVV